VKRQSIITAWGLGLLIVSGALTSGCGDGSSSTAFDDCDASIPEDECYALRRDPDSDQVALALEIARRYVAQHPYEEEIWDWRSGVLMFALTELYRVTGEEDIRDYYQSWMDYRIEQGYSMTWSDSCPPALTAIALLDEEAEAASYRQVVEDALEYLDEVAPRTEENGISHNGLFGNIPSVWLDSLFMFGMVLNRWGEAYDEARLEMMSEQTQIIAGVLQDENGFMRHAQDWPGYDESVYWARGNSWVVASLADYLRIRVQDGAPDAPVERIFRDHVDAVLGAQQPSGLWLTVMSHPDEPENYLETSASALFAYGIARAYRYGVLGEDERRRAQDTVESIEQMMVRRDDDGPVVTQVSLATDPWSLEEYLTVPVGEDVNFGVGSVILALIETSGLPE
jgi:unsaturated rhamnogalacturonyl hydrolase